MNYSLYRAFLEQKIESFFSHPYSQQHEVQVKELSDENLQAFLDFKLITPREREAIELRFSEEAVMPYRKVGEIMGAQCRRPGSSYVKEAVRSSGLGLGLLPENKKAALPAALWNRAVNTMVQRGGWLYF